MNAANRTVGRGMHTSGLMVLLGAMALLLGGCNGFGGGAAWMTPPWARKAGPTPEELTGIKPPYERMADLRQLAADGPGKSAIQQQEICRRLEAEFRAEQDPLIRAQIVRTANAFKTSEASALLRTAMDDGSLDVRIAACEAWGSRGGPEAVDALGQSVAADESIDVRLAAARALGETGDAKAVQRLAVALEDEDPALQRRAVLSMHKISGKDFGNDVNRWRQYAKGETPTPAEPVSVAERFRRLF